jgi:hypothetical protein
MFTADRMANFLMVLGCLLAFPGLWLLSRALWPHTVMRSADICRKGLIKPFIYGFPLTVFVILVIAIFANSMSLVGKGTALILASLYVILAHSGVAGLVTCIGERLTSHSDAGQAWHATLRGGIVLDLAYLLPVVGWFFLLPVSMIIGSGTNLIIFYKIFLETSKVKLLEQDSQPITDRTGVRVTGNLGPLR